MRESICLSMSLCACLSLCALYIFEDKSAWMSVHVCTCEQMHGFSLKLYIHKQMCASVSVFVCAKQSISLVGDSSWSPGQHRIVGKLDVTAIPIHHQTDTCKEAHARKQLCKHTRRHFAAFKCLGLHMWGNLQRASRN